MDASRPQGRHRRAGADHGDAAHRRDAPWRLRPRAAQGTTSYEPISFGLQTATPPKVHVINPGGSVPAGCSGSVANPGAESGNLCIFEGEVANGTLIELDLINHAQDSATTFGGTMKLSATVGEGLGNGSWAVTG